MVHGHIFVERKSTIIQFLETNYLLEQTQNYMILQRNSKIPVIQIPVIQKEVNDKTLSIFITHIYKQTFQENVKIGL